MKRPPFFSIVIPTYNRSHDLRFALFCILRQKFSDYEIVISDNCSVDDTKKIVKQFRDPRIRYIRNKTNIGMIKNQALSIHRARGKYILLHGDDDFLLYETSLRDIHSSVMKYRPGYIRINYASLAFDKKHIFSYRVYKRFDDDYYFPIHQANDAVTSFVIDVDSYFFSGILFRNDLPRDIEMVNADPAPWIHILLYLTRKYGGLFIKKRHFLALWSRRTKQNEDHGFYKPVDGKLKAEQYFNVVKAWMSDDAYMRFLRKELITIYVNLFPAIKVSVGNENFRIVVNRVRALCPDIIMNSIYWKSFIVAWIIPKALLRMIKEWFLFFYIRFSRADKQTEDTYRQLEKEYDRFIFSLRQA